MSRRVFLHRVVTAVALAVTLPESVLQWHPEPTEGALAYLRAWHNKHVAFKNVRAIRVSGRLFDAAEGEMQAHMRFALENDFGIDTLMFKGVVMIREHAWTGWRVEVA